MPNAADVLVRAIDQSAHRAPVCVGLDPVLEKLPAACRRGTPDGQEGAVVAIRHFCEGVLQAAARREGGEAGEAGPIRGGGGPTKPIAPAVKLQSACFERYGAPGVALLNDMIRLGQSLGLTTILDAKRGDIGVSAEHYASAAFDHAGADWLTVSPYLGPDTLEPYLTAKYQQAGKGIFGLVRTSNPGSDQFQSPTLATGGTVGEMIARAVDQLGQSRLGSSGLSCVGAVVGATKAADARALRAIMPSAIFLIPGYGAQGGTADDIRAMLRPGASSPGHSGVLVTASRSVIYAFTPEEGADDRAWVAAVGRAADTLATEVGAIVASR